MEDETHKMIETKRYREKKKEKNKTPNENTKKEEK